MGWSLTLAQVETEVRRHIRDTASDTTLQRYSDTSLDLIINETQRDVNSQTWAVETATSTSLVASTTFYTLPTDFIASRRAYFIDSAGMRTYLTEDSEESVMKSPDTERSSTGKPTRYYVREQKDGDDPLEFGVIPVPTSSSTGTVVMHYIAQPSDLSSDSDVPFNGYSHLIPYHQVLVWGAVLRIKLIEAKTNEATAYAQLYDRSIQSMKDGVGRMPNFRPSASPAR